MIRLALAMLAMGATTASDTRDLDKALAGRTAGTAETCLSTSRQLTPQAMNDHVLLYQDGPRIWRNDLPAACPGLDTDAIIVTEIHGGQLCRNDMIYTLQRGGIGIPGPRCRIGMFVPWNRVKTTR
ncbi:hypothetical protein [Sphingomonas sp. TREG-RG-20F-R18-01]|uniref:hypothetical protein n=1 Tax=Sphingomonas sp. TREG-RG-20F-R18-01 TaxID=2914982 RepID=UPI001F5A61FC